MERPPVPSKKHLKATLLALLVLGIVALVLIGSGLSVSFQLLDSTGTNPPQGGFHVEGGDGNVTITRDVGAPVDAGNLAVRVDGETRGTWQDLSGGTATVAVGENVTVRRVETGDAVALYWTGGRAPQRLLRTDA